MKKIIIVVGIIAGFLGILLIGFLLMVKILFSGMEKCGMATGPLYPDVIEVNKDSIIIEQYVDIPNGRLGLANLSDTLAPKLIRYDMNDSLIWAVEFKENSKEYIPFHYQLSKVTLHENGDKFLLSFFNYDADEPGNIHLNEEYEVEYMCLSVM